MFYGHVRVEYTSAGLRLLLDPLVSLLHITDEYGVLMKW